MSQTEATRQGDYIVPPTKTGFYAPHKVSVTTSAQTVDLHSGYTWPNVPSGRYITLQVVSGGPVHLQFHSATSGTAVSANTGYTLNAGEQRDYKLFPGSTGDSTFPHRYLHIIGDATAVVKWYVSTKMEIA